MKLDLFKGIDKVFENYAQDIQNNIQTELSWTDNLKNSVDIQVSGTGQDTKMEVSMPLYGYVIDQGAKWPGWGGKRMPPFGVDSPLVPWIVKKFGVEEKEAIQLSFPIARKIASTGLPARPWIDKALDEPTFLNQIATQMVKNFIQFIEVESNEGMFMSGRIPWNKKTM
jgi:hypothetical protein